MRYSDVPDDLEENPDGPPTHASLNSASLIEFLKFDLKHYGSDRIMTVAQSKESGSVEITDYKPAEKIFWDFLKGDEIVTMSGAELMHKLIIQDSVTPLPKDYFLKENPVTTVELRDNFDVIGFADIVVDLYRQHKNEIKMFMKELKGAFPVYKLDKSYYKINGDTDYIKLFYRCIDDTLCLNINLKAKEPYSFETIIDY